MHARAGGGGARGEKLKQIPKCTHLECIYGQRSTLSPASWLWPSDADDDDGCVRYRVHAQAGGGGARGEKLIRATVCSTPPTSYVASWRESAILCRLPFF